MATPTFSPEPLVHSVPLAAGGTLKITLRALSYVEKVQATTLAISEADPTERLLKHARTVAAAVTAAHWLNAAGEAVDGPTDFSDIAGGFWAGLDLHTTSELFVALMEHGRLTAQEKKESDTSLSG